MLNQVVLVGRLANDIQLEERDNKKYATITLAVPRSYKNEEGIYETDFVKCLLWNGIAQNTTEYCKKGDLIGIKGRLESDNITRVIAEKVTFLSSRKENEEE